MKVTDFSDDKSTLVAWQHQAITWTNADQVLWSHMWPMPQLGKYEWQNKIDMINF